jgi:hypothetical protein
MKAKQQRKIKMKRLSVTFGTLLLVLGCFGLSSTVQAAGRNPIVGLWSVHYVSTTGGPEAFAYIQWHNDGLEFEVAGFAPGAMCQGTFKQAPDGSYHDYHIAWTFDSTGAPSGYWDENMIVTVSAGAQSYSGTYARKFYDVNGNFLFEDDGTMTAERLPERY